MSTPYKTLPTRSFWKPAIAQRSFFDIDELWEPKWSLLPSDPVVTFGSCFAQHIGRAMVQRGYNWLNAEVSPSSLSVPNAKKFNFGVFSARTGNIYTASLLLQWVRWAVYGANPPDEVWQLDGRYYDPFRPTIEPGGFASVDELQRSRAVSIAAFRQCIETAKVFVFTVGLTESWHNQIGYEYPLCPGTVAGEFDTKAHRFLNQDYTEILSNLETSFEIMKTINQNLRFILTTSPVPLVATNSGQHVLVATMGSKSIIRAVCGHLTLTRKDVDYFPSYEIINSPVFRGAFFEPNAREVNPKGVAFVMDHFFSSLVKKYGEPNIIKPVDPVAMLSNEDIVCEEELLAAFGS